MSAVRYGFATVRQLLLWYFRRYERTVEIDIDLDDASRRLRTITKLEMFTDTLKLRRNHYYAAQEEYTRCI